MSTIKSLYRVPFKRFACANSKPNKCYSTSSTQSTHNYTIQQNKGLSKWGQSAAGGGGYVWNERRATRPQYLTTNISLNNPFGVFIQRELHTGKTESKMSNLKRDIIPISEVKRFIVDCFVASNTPKEHAELMADLLVDADYRGHFSHGMNRLEMYLNDLQCGTMDGHAVPKILKETPATAWVDGNNGLGAVNGKFCMELAIKKAKNVGVGWVSCKHSNHYGIAGWHAIHAQKEGLIGLSMTNTSPAMVPTRSKGEKALGTNPISLAAPAKNGDGMVLDMATTAVAIGKIEVQRRKNQPIPAGWALGHNDEITTDSKIAFDASKLMPLGGSEITSGYKGYGLAVLVETLCGILSGAHYATNIRKWSLEGNDVEADLGQVFIAVDPNCFAPDFEGRMSDMNGTLRNLPAMDESKPVLVPGDPERAHMKKVDEEGGIRYHVNQITNCDELATKFNVRPIGSNVN